MFSWMRFAAEIFRFADRKEDLDWIERRNGRAPCCSLFRRDRPPVLAQCQQRLDRRCDLAEIQIQLCLLDICLERFDFGCVRFVELYLVGVLLFGNHLLVEEFLAALGLRLRRSCIA